MLFSEGWEDHEAAVKIIMESQEIYRKEGR
jgi:inorganic pyrophosphatase